VVCVSADQAEFARAHAGLEAGAGLERGHQPGDPPPVGAQRGAELPGGAAGLRLTPEDIAGIAG